MAKEPKTEEKKAEPTESVDVGIHRVVRAEVQSAMNGVLQQIHSQLQAKQTGLNQLAAAYIEAVKACRPAVKNAQNPHLRNTYADLGSVLDAVRTAFLDQNLWLVQSPGKITIKEGLPYGAMSGLLLHSSGQSIGFEMELPAFSVESKKNGGGTIINPQTAGSCFAYGRRYMWAAVSGITQVDDDADAVSYNDGAEGPSEPASNLLDSSASVRSTPKSDEAAEMIAKIEACPTMDALKALRTDAQDVANRLNDKKVTAAYMAKRESFLAAA